MEPDFRKRYPYTHWRDVLFDIFDSFHKYRRNRQVHSPGIAADRKCLRLLHITNGHFVAGGFIGVVNIFSADRAALYETRMARKIA